MSSSASGAVTAKYVGTDRLDLDVSASEGFDFFGELLVVPFYKPKVEKGDEAALIRELKARIPEGINEEIKAAVDDLITSGLFKGDGSKQTRVYTSSASVSVALVGLGPDPKETADEMEVATASKLGKSVATLAQETKAERIGLVLPTGMESAAATQFFLGMHDGSYVDNRFRKVPEGGTAPHLKYSLSLLGCSESVAKEIKHIHKYSNMIGEGVDLARDLVGAPPNSVDPIIIANVAKEIANEHNLKCTILGEKECKELGMGSYLGVQQGSKYPPQFVHLTYTPETVTPNTVKIALIGKGLTFDSGGYNLKVAGSLIELMKIDMGGAGAVFGSAKAIAALRPENVEVHWISAVCENMISADAMKPGDVLTASNGKTIEILNTDAEGRLTLADALVYADKLGVDYIVDLATLTGACMVALGDKLGGLYSADKQLQEDLEKAAKRSDEGLWPLPLEASYKESIKSSIADLKNLGGKYGGSITAALFLQEFVENPRWAHIDLAGPVFDFNKQKATGYGVKTLVDFVLNAKKPTA